MNRPIALLACAGALLALALGSPAAGQTPAPVAVGGTFTYADLDPATGTTTARPIAFARVEIWRCALPLCLFWTHDGDAVTDAGGTVAATFPWDGTIRRYALRVLAANYAAEVRPRNTAKAVPPWWTEPGAPDATPIEPTAAVAGAALDFSYAFVRRAESRYYNMADVVRRARDVASKLRDPSETDPLTVASVLPLDVGPPTFYDPFQKQITILPAHWDDDAVIAHEYGHHVQNDLASMPPAPSFHDGCIISLTQGGPSVNTQEVAFMEGFADWFAQALKQFDPTLGGGAMGGTPTVASLETPGPCPFPVEEVELRVAGLLWDLSDANGAGNLQTESWDVIEARHDDVLGILDRELDTPASGYPTVTSFIAAVRSRGLGGPAFDGILAALGFSVPHQFAGEEVWTDYPLPGPQWTFADVDGDRAADAIELDAGCIRVALSRRSAFDKPYCWAWGPISGRIEFGDVDGDGRADVIVAGKRDVRVRRSLGPGGGFGPEEVWLSGLAALRFLGVGDVDGDGTADLVLADDLKLVVAPSSGEGFRGLEVWGPVVGGGDGVRFADVTGDGRADEIVVDGEYVHVRPSTGTSFLGETAFGAPAGRGGTWFADVDGDGAADMIVVSAAGAVTVRTWNGKGFEPLPGADWSRGLLLGTPTNAFADVTGDGRADALSVNWAQIVVRRAI